MDRPSHAMERLKGQGNGYAVWRVTGPDGDVTTLKSWPLLLKPLLTFPVGMSQAQRQARGARRLRDLGVPTPQIVSGPSLAGLALRLELEWVPGLTALEVLRSGELESGVLRAAASSLGTHVATIASGGFMHRDLKLSNVIIERSEDGVQPWIIDTVGVRRCTSTSGAVYRMLERLLAEIRREEELVELVRPAVVRAALRPLSRPVRRAVCERLRAHR